MPKFHFLEGEIPMKLRIVCVLLALLSLVSLTVAQTSPQAASALPRLVRFGGTVKDLNGSPLTGVVGITFAFYSEKTGGAPLWLETQNATADSAGHYTVLLGSTKPEGLPADLFTTEQARWVGVQVSGQPDQPRVLLVSAPYALKAGDAETIGGLPPSAFVLAAPPVMGTATAGNTSATVPPPAATDVTTTGGTLNYLPIFSGANTIIDSAVFQTGSGTTAKVGINTTTPVTQLDVNGAGNIRGTLSLPATGLATAGGGKNSQGLNLAASSFSSTSSTALNQVFRLQAEPAANDTTAPSGTLNLQYGLGATAPSETGFKISSKGLVTFAAGQTFPGTAELGTADTFTKPITFAAGQAFPGTLTAVTAASPLTATTTAGKVSLGLNTATLETTLNTVYAQLGASNTFTAGQIIEGVTSVSGPNESGPTLSVSNNGDSFSSAISATNSGQYGIGISAASGENGDGIEGFGVQSAGSIGVLGALANSNGFSNSFFLLESDDGLDSGVWADGANGQEAALIATSDDLSAAVFFNDSSASSTILVLNNSSGGPLGNAIPGFGSVLRAEGPGGACGINQTGSLACTGQVKTLATTQNGARQVETYSVQSAENWLEDYGSGQLNHGGVTVTLDPVFADTVNTGVDFHVFLTPGGDCKGLYVTNKTATSFEVHELGGGTTSIPFDYKIVAKRRGHETERLVDVTDRMHLEANLAHFKRLPRSLPRKMMTRNVPPASPTKPGNIPGRAHPQ
jgi:hypothetical protein